MNKERNLMMISIARLHFKQGKTSAKLIILLSGPSASQSLSQFLKDNLEIRNISSPFPLVGLLVYQSVFLHFCMLENDHLLK